MKIELLFSVLFYFVAEGNAHIYVKMENDGVVLNCSDVNAVATGCSWTKQFTTEGPAIPVEGNEPGPTNSSLDRLEIWNRPNEGVCVLIINYLVLEDSAFYSCDLQPNILIKTFQVVVGAVPSVPQLMFNGTKVVDGDEIVVTGNNLTLSCQIQYARQGPPAAITWKHGENPRNPGSMEVRLDDFRLRLVSHLELSASDLPDQGTQTLVCVAIHPYYPSMTSEAHVTLRKSI